LADKIEENALYKALEVLDLPPFITKDELKNRYRDLAKKYHPDVSEDVKRMSEINEAYELLMHYIENFRYSFDNDEISKQMPDFTLNGKFRV